MKLDKIPLDSLKGVGSKMLEKLARLGLATVQDLLFHLPLRYEDRTQVWPIGDLPPGLHGAVEGEIQDTQLVMGRRRMLVCRISDGTGSLTLRFFNFTAAQKNSLAQGRLIRCFGEARPGKYGLEMAHPEYKLLGEEQAGQTEEALTPVYPTTEGLRQLSLRDVSTPAKVTDSVHCISGKPFFLHPFILLSFFFDRIISDSNSQVKSVAFLHRKSRQNRSG